MDSIILIGPEQWGKDHREFLVGNKTTALQYSAITSGTVEQRLKQLQCPFDIYIYVPKIYTLSSTRTGLLYGPGKIIFKGNVIEFNSIGKSFLSRRFPISSPYPTIKGPMAYDKKPDFKYEYWFKSDRLEYCDFEISQFYIILNDGSSKQYDVKHFAPTFRGNIVFAKKPETIYSNLR